MFKFLLAMLFPLISYSHEVQFFPNKMGWTGGDAIYSIPYGEDKTLWLFGDSFIHPDPNETVDRESAYFINNSVGISSNDDLNSIEYHWGESVTGTPASIFPFPETDSHSFFWPKDSFWHSGKLYIYLLEVKIENPQHALDFKISGVTLAKIANPMDIPRDWVVKYIQLPRQNGNYPGSASIVLNDGYAYSLSIGVGENLSLQSYSLMAGRIQSQIGELTEEEKELFESWKSRQEPLSPAYRKRAVFLQRLKLADLENDIVTLETWDQNNLWQNHFEYKTAKELFEPGSDEMSLSFEEASGKFTVVYSLPLINNNVIVRQAEKLTGVWSEPVEYEAYQPIYPDLFGEVNYYAAKHHPHLSQAGKMFFTYVTNSLTPHLLYSYPNLYRPIFFYKDWSF